MPTHKEKEKQVKKERKNLQSKSSRDEQTPPPERRGKFPTFREDYRAFTTVLDYISARELVKSFWKEQRDRVLQFRQGMNDEIVYLQMKEEKERKRRENSEKDEELRKKAESASL